MVDVATTAARNRGLVILVLCVILTVAATPAQAQNANLLVSPSSLTFNYVIGAPQLPATQSIFVTSSSPFTAFPSHSWITLNPPNGSSRLTVGVNPVGLSAGTYSGTVTVTSEGASNSPQTVAVVFTVETS